MNTLTKRISIIVTILAVLVPVLKGQTFGIKTNLVSDLTTSINLGAEAAVAPKWSVALSGEVNPWNFSNGARLKHLSGNGRLRYWMCEPFNGHFIGAGLQGGSYNIGGIKGLPNVLGTDFSTLGDQRYQGWYAGVGVSYGYDWIINRNWNIEAVIGAGWNHTRYDVYPCTTCGTKKKSNVPRNYFGLTEAAVNLTYVF